MRTVRAEIPSLIRALCVCLLLLPMNTAYGDKAPPPPYKTDINRNAAATESYSSSDPDSGGASGSRMLDVQAGTDDEKIDYVAIAEALRAGCAAAQTDKSIPFPGAAVYLDTFFVIQGRAKWLPPYPKNPNSTIHGIDVDGDCVRDDIEHYIARKYRKRGQYKLRKYLYEYAVWMDQFLISGLSVNTAKTSFNNMAAAGECVSRIIGDKAAQDALNDLFANFHNTWPRTYRYLDNVPRLGGWTTREKLTISCP